jgi:hypothetical protein
MAVVDELVTLLSFKTSPGTEKAIKSIKDGISTLKSEVTKWAAAATAAGAATSAFLLSASDKAIELQKLSQSTNLSTDSLQQWQYAAEAVGASSAAVTSDLESLLKTMSSPIPGELNMELMMLGVSVHNASGQLRGADEVLKDVGDKLNKMSSARAVQWAERVGISNDTLMLLKQGRQGLSELFEEAQLVGAIIPEDAINRGAELSKSIKTLKTVFQALGNSIALSFAPNLKKVVDNFKQFLINNADFVRQGLGITIDGVSRGFGRFWDILVKIKDGFVALLQPMQPFLKNMDAVKIVAGLVTGALAGFLALMAPAIIQFAAVGAAIAGVSLVIEDFITWLQGGESVIGDIVNAFSNWMDKFPELKEDLKSVGQVFADVFNAIPGLIDKCIDKIEDMFPVINKILSGLGKVVDFVYEGAKTAGETLTDGVLKVFGGYEGQGARENARRGEKILPQLTQGQTEEQPGAVAPAGNNRQQQPEKQDTSLKDGIIQLLGFGGEKSGSGENMIQLPKAEDIDRMFAEYDKARAIPSIDLTIPPQAQPQAGAGKGIVNNNQTITIMTGADARSVIQAMQTEMPDANVVSSGTYGSFIGGY